MTKLQARELVVISRNQKSVCGSEIAFRMRVVEGQTHALEDCTEIRFPFLLLRKKRMRKGLREKESTPILVFHFCLVPFFSLPFIFLLVPSGIQNFSESLVSSGRSKLLFKG